MQFVLRVLRALHKDRPGYETQGSLMAFGWRRELGAWLSHMSSRFAAESMQVFTTFGKSNLIVVEKQTLNVRRPTVLDAQPQRS